MRESVPADVATTNIDIWFQDEARIGQQGTISRIWAKRGTRPRAVRQQQFESAYIFGAVCPDKELDAALILPKACTEAMQLHIDEISTRVPEGRHAVLVMDKAAWHTTKKLQTHKNITLFPLPPVSPELNPQEQIWQWLRNNHFSNRVFKDYNEILEVACSAWNDMTNKVGLIKSIASRGWAQV